MRKALAYIWILIVSIILICPLLLTFVYSFSQSWDSIFPGKFTLLFYQTIFNDPTFIPSVLRGFIISFIPIIADEYSCSLSSLLFDYLQFGIRANPASFMYLTTHALFF